ncbi:hypothetical protein SAMN04487948_10114 [Halogranum amylolyticum]|uniref:Uncharacterized protein n=1 Tax=Halogranum amylolyticum TaxID=660520 RepID=A0A1H8MPH5_9EURY|nr:hypothetical protein [Halogranum amylolyticum]SEO19371.1 hypothetical protein SAMN04487948_10114 [Halogranum amylolyticum]
MTQPTHRHRRTVLKTLAGSSLALIAGCTGKAAQSDETNGETAVQRDGVLEHVAIEKTTLVVELANDDPDVINLIEPTGELWKSRDVATGAERVSFAIGTSYTPGEHRVLAVKDNESIAEVALDIRPQLEILDVGLYRNHPEKPWEEVYGEGPSKIEINSQAFVTITNTGSGPDKLTKLHFTGDIPNKTEAHHESGLSRKSPTQVGAKETIDVFSDMLPFGLPYEDDEIRCSIEGTEGEFTVSIETQVAKQPIEKTFSVAYSGANEMRECDIAVGEI